MEKRRDDRDARKTYDEATDNPREANKTDESQQAAELQVGEAGEREDTTRFEPDTISQHSRSHSPEKNAQRQESSEKEFDPEP